jgi:hypothetical protein
MSHEFSVEARHIVFSRVGRTQFGGLDLETGAYHGETDGRCISDALCAIELHSNVTH